MEFADHILGGSTSLAKDAVPGQDLVVRDRVDRPQRGQLTEHGLGRIRRFTNQRGPISAASLPRRPNAFSSTLLQRFSQKTRQSGEPPGRITEVNLLAGEAIELRWLPELSSALARHQVAERHQPLEVVVSDGSVDSDGLGDIVDGPLGCMHIKIQENSAAGRILECADGSIDLSEIIVCHLRSVPGRKQARG